LQAWRKHGEKLDEAASTKAAELLAECCGGAPAAPIGAISGGSQGSQIPNPAGASPRVSSRSRLVEAPGQVYREAANFIAEVKVALAGKPPRRMSV
jgi:hypothetical protein